MQLWHKLVVTLLLCIIARAAFLYVQDARIFRHWQKKYAKLAEGVVREAKAKPPPPGSIMSALLNHEDPTTGVLASEHIGLWITQCASDKHALRAPEASPSHLPCPALICLTIHELECLNVDDYCT